MTKEKQQKKNETKRTLLLSERNNTTAEITAPTAHSAHKAGMRKRGRGDVCAREESTAPRKRIQLNWKGNLSRGGVTRKNNKKDQ